MYCTSYDGSHGLIAERPCDGRYGLPAEDFSLGKTTKRMFLQRSLLFGFTVYHQQALEILPGFHQGGHCCPRSPMFYSQTSRDCTTQFHSHASLTSTPQGERSSVQVAMFSTLPQVSKIRCWTSVDHRSHRLF